MDINTIISIAGTLIGLASVILAYLQLKYQFLDTIKEKSLGTDGISELFSIFAPDAIIDGMTRNFTNREPQIKNMIKSVLKRNAVIFVEGIPGSGKTALIAKFCKHPIVKINKYKVAWIFASERQLNLDLIAESLIQKYSQRKTANLLQNIQTRSVHEKIDLIINILSKNKLLLVIDDFHLVNNDDIYAMIEKFAKSKTNSTLILSSPLRPSNRLGLILENTISIKGLDQKNASILLSNHGLKITGNQNLIIWKKSGEGIPEALNLFAVIAKKTKIDELLSSEFPVYTIDAQKWLSKIENILSPEEIRILKTISFFREPVEMELVLFIHQQENILPLLDLLAEKMIITIDKKIIHTYPALSKYILERISQEEKTTISKQATVFFEEKSRKLILGDKGIEEPSYGLAYIDANPEYILDKSRHIKFVENLLRIMLKHGVDIKSQKNVLVLGAGHGTHDIGLHKHGFNITNIEILDEVIKVGRDNALKEKIEARYIKSDMTELITAVPESSQDIVFNIGSSFGFETNQKNLMVFKNAFRLLKPGGFFMFEYVNGAYWSKNVDLKTETRILPNGNIRNSYKIVDSLNRTSIEFFSLVYPSGKVSKFRHYMHYYTLDEVKTMIHECGFVVVAIYGSENMDDFDSENSRSMIILAKKMA